MFESLETLAKFAEDPESIWSSLAELMQEHPPLLVLLGRHTSESEFAMFREVFLKPGSQVFVETVDRASQTPVHFVEKHIGKRPFCRPGNCA